MKQIVKPRVLLPTMLGLMGAGVLSRTLAYLLCYDAGIGYLEKGNVFSAIWAVVLALSICFAILVTAIGRKRISPERDCPSACTMSARSSAIISMAACFLGALYFILKMLDKSAGALDIAGAVTCVIAAYHYVALASCGHAKQTACLLTGYVVPVAFALVIADMYFEMTVTLNNPDKVMFICSFMLFMVIQLLELRFILKRALPSLYIAVGILSVVVGAAASIPFVVAVFCNVYNRIVMSSDALMVLALTVATLLRLTSYIKVCGDAEGHSDNSKDVEDGNSPDTETVPSTKTDKTDVVKEETVPSSDDGDDPSDEPVDEV